MTACTLGCTGGQQPGVMRVITGSRVMVREVIGVIDRVIDAVTNRTAAVHTLNMVDRSAVCHCDKGTVGCAGMTVLAAFGRPMNTGLDIAAVAVRRTVGRAGQQAMRFCCIDIIIPCF